MIEFTIHKVDLQIAKWIYDWIYDSQSEFTNRKVIWLNLWFAKWIYKSQSGFMIEFMIRIWRASADKIPAGTEF